MIQGENIFDSGSECERELSHYKQLFSAIILQAEADKYSKDKDTKEDAIRFLASEDMQILLEYIDMKCGSL